jgi:serine/threonine-protein kinase RIO1
MVNKGFVDHVHGAISTGKEANVCERPRKLTEDWLVF